MSSAASPNWHPAPSVLRAFSQRRLPPEMHGRTEAHLDACASCRLAVDALITEPYPGYDHAASQRPLHSGRPNAGYTVPTAARRTTTRHDVLPSPKPAWKRWLSGDSPVPGIVAAGMVMMTIVVSQLGREATEVETPHPEQRSSLEETFRSHNLTHRGIAAAWQTFSDGVRASASLHHGALNTPQALRRAALFGCPPWRFEADVEALRWGQWAFMAAYTEAERHPKLNDTTVDDFLAWAERRPKSSIAVLAALEGFRRVRTPARLRLALAQIMTPAYM